MSSSGQFSVYCVSSAASEADQLVSFQLRQKLESATLGNFSADTFLEQTEGRLSSTLHNVEDEYLSFLQGAK